LVLRLHPMRKILFSLSLFTSVLVLSSMTPVPTDGPVQWMTFEEAVEKSKTEKRKFIIDVYTDWCGWCKVMDKKTFNDPEVAKLLNEKFYAVKLDAEQTADIQFKGTAYKYVSSGRSGVHQLAAALLNNQLSYPTVVFVEEDFKSVSPIPGYKEAPEFHKMLVYFDSGYYKNGETGRTEFEKIYKSPYAAAVSNNK
jgi:thioredoxin-related protein